MPGDGFVSDVQVSPPGCSKDYGGMQPVCDLSSDMGDHVSGESTGAGARMDVSPAANPPLNTPSPVGTVDKPKKGLFSGVFGSSKKMTRPEEAKVTPPPLVCFLVPSRRSVRVPHPVPRTFLAS